MDPICGMETDDEPHECPYCGGSGAIMTGCEGNGEEMCPACDGSGEE